MKANFDNTVSILVKAYLNDTLQHGSCYACAVGNIIASGLGCEVVRIRKAFRDLSWSNNMDYPGLDRNEIKGWGAAFSTEFNDAGDLEQMRYEPALKNPFVSEQIVASGYSWIELAMIEFAFESSRKNSTGDELMFNGLMAVVEVLASIHSVDLKVKEQAKQLFVKV